MRTPGYPLARLALAATSMLLITSCSKLVMMRPYELTDRPATVQRASERRPLTGYVTDDGKYHAFTGWAEIGADSVRFHGQVEYGTPQTPPPPLRRDQVKMLFVSTVVGGLSAGVLATFLLGATTAIGLFYLAVLSTLGD